MWLITPRGFFSVVEKYKDTEDGVVTVRTRNKADIDSLADLLPNAKPFRESFSTDYEWRIRVPKTDWAIAAAKMVMEIDYSNFKGEVQRVQGKKRSDVYHNLWFELLALEDKGRKPTYGTYGSATTADGTDYDKEAWGNWDDMTDAELDALIAEEDQKEKPAAVTKIQPKPKPKVQPKSKPKGQQSPRRRARSRKQQRNASTTKRQPARKAA